MEMVQVGGYENSDLYYHACMIISWKATNFTILVKDPFYKTLTLNTRQ